MFIDEAQINVRGGDGGAGCASFLHEYRRPKGGPDGGDGGRGGDVLFVADPSVATLLRFKTDIHHKAASGRHGSSRERHGRRGGDLRILVPPGTVVKTLDGELVADLVQPGDACAVAAGGRGGRGNARFATPRRRAPTFAEQGEPGDEHWLRLELRLLADVALVGFPNAGKSTFIASVSAAKPKIADYPFTTLEPHLGVARVDDGELVIADIPGLIEGASEGRGLGHRFLRHVERTRVLVLLLDPLNPEVSVTGQHTILLEELGKYRPDLLHRPRIVCITKMDAVANSGDFTREPPGARPISAVSGLGMRELLLDLLAETRSERAATVPQAGHIVHRPHRTGVSVRRENGTWIVEGADARRAVALNDLTDAQALAYVQDRLRRLGVDAALAEAGCGAGDVVRIGDFVFEYEPEP